MTNEETLQHKVDELTTKLERSERLNESLHDWNKRLNEENQTLYEIAQLGRNVIRNMAEYYDRQIAALDNRKVNDCYLSNVRKYIDSGELPSDELPF